MLMTCSVIASEQVAPTEETMKKTMQFLDYVASRPDSILAYSASSMVLHVHRDASYLSKLKAKIRAGVHVLCGTMKRTQQTMGRC